MILLKIIVVEFPLSKIHSSISSLRRGTYQVLDDDIGGDTPKDFIKINQNKYIAKVGHKWYPLESISEYLLNQIGKVLRLNMAEPELKVAHGQLRFLSQYFLKKGENMVHRFIQHIF